ncbi:MAG: TolC family protein, partial [Verrucomicrobiae bacterium]|nr:TolC family protein [Verrucomicrobiae bacterium]
LGSCAPSFYEKAADRETRRILGSKTGKVENVDNESLSIKETEMMSLDDLKKNDSKGEFLGKLASSEKDAKVLTLAEALGLAINHNRGYLSQKETLYLQALDLTLTRHELAPIFSAGGDATYREDYLEGDPPPPPDPPPAPDPVVDPVTGEVTQPAAPVAAQVEQQIDGLIATRTFTRNQRVGFTMLQRTGARLAADFTSDFLNFIAGDRSINHSKLAVTLTQPLLKGGGFRTTMENLTQADRELLYSLRDFANFRREFVVDIVSRYYGVLQARDAVKNNWAAYKGFVKNIEREEALGEEGRRTQTELGQLRQALLQSESQWVNSIRDYQNQLDELKIELGLPVEEKIVLLENELTMLQIEDPGIKKDEAVELALTSRPDLETARDRVADAERKIKVAKVDLQAGLDAVATYDAISDPDDITPNLNFERRAWTAGVQVDLPIDRKAERNFYRSTLIALEQSKRQETLSYDQVRLQVYDDWRSLEQAKRNFEINELGVQLAERRLEEQELLSDLGRGEARDLVDAQRDLVNSQNQRTQTLVEHTLARLRLWQDMGILYINQDGSWVKKLEEEGTVHE